MGRHVRWAEGWWAGGWKQVTPGTASYSQDSIHDRTGLRGNSQDVPGLEGFGKGKRSLEVDIDQFPHGVE